MKIIIAALAAVTALSAVAVTPASAQPYGHHRGWHRGWDHRPMGHHHHHPVCVIRHHHRICR